jgi:hypothetical protein
LRRSKGLNGARSRYEESRSLNSNPFIQSNLSFVIFLLSPGVTLRIPKINCLFLDLTITNQAISHGIECKLQTVVDTQLLENVAEMSLYSLFTDKQLTGNFFVPVPRRY